MNIRDMIFRRIRPTVIPAIVHSRSQLNYFRKEFEDGAQCLYVSCDTYPELLKFLYPMICVGSPTGWKQRDDQPHNKYLWFPPESLTDSEVESLDAWGQHYKQAVLLGLNDYTKDHFCDELDFCVALDFNIVPDEDRRTEFGEAEYQVKYNNGGVEEFETLVSGLVKAYGYLPLLGSDDDLMMTSIPVKTDGNQLATKLTEAVAEELGKAHLAATLHCEKQQMKELSVQEKIIEWTRLYDTAGCIELSADVTGKTIVVIDDLYQSGATMWCYAKHLKEQGARAVVGLSCVKALRDSDNQD